MTMSTSGKSTHYHCFTVFERPAKTQVPALGKFTNPAAINQASGANFHSLQTLARFDLLTFTASVGSY